MPQLGRPFEHDDEESQAAWAYPHYRKIPMAKIRVRPIVSKGQRR
jgi:hypothetical protein